MSTCKMLEAAENQVNFYNFKIVGQTYHLVIDGFFRDFWHTSELVGELAALNLRHRNLGIRAFDHAQYDAPPAPLVLFRG